MEDPKTNYQGNSKRPKGEDAPDAPKKEIVKVVSGEVVVKKKSVGQKLKGIFVEADFKSVAQYVVASVLIPAARNMIVDGATKGVERMMYGDRGPARPRGIQYGTGPRMTYGGSPLQSRTDYRSPMTRPPVGGVQHPRPQREDFIMTSREDAQSVVDNLYDILEQWEVVSVADYHDLLGHPTSHTDQKWGWLSLQGTTIRPIREGFLIDLPQAEPI